MWCRYANEDFDVAQTVATALTDADRAAGRPAPAVGYSAENMARVTRIIREGSGFVDARRVLALAQGVA
jgi:hypothetical protein